MDPFGLCINSIFVLFKIARQLTIHCASKVKMSVLGKNRNVSKIDRDLSLTIIKHDIYLYWQRHEKDSHYWKVY